MSGQAIIRIDNQEWIVTVASLPWELSQGLGGIQQIPIQTGMLFDLGETRFVQVTTVPMLFPLDIAFISENLVITEVYQNVQPEQIINSQYPARYILEVNAGEMTGIQPGSAVLISMIAPAFTIGDIVQPIVTAASIVFAGMALTAMMRILVEAIVPPKELSEMQERLALTSGFMEYRVEQNYPGGTWAIVELFPGGTVRSPFKTKEEAIKREEEIGEYYGWKLKRVEFTPEEVALLDPERFPQRTEALAKLKGYDVIYVHDDGDLTVRSRDKIYVVTTEGQIFEQKYLAQTQKSSPHGGSLDVFALSRELEKYVPGFKVDVMQLPVPKFTQTIGVIDDKKKKINIYLWPDATREDAFAILAHEYAHIKPGTTQIERGLTEVQVWKRGAELARQWGVIDSYQKLAEDLAEYYESRKIYPNIARGIREWLLEALPQTKATYVEIMTPGQTNLTPGSIVTIEELERENRQARERGENPATARIWKGGKPVMISPKVINVEKQEGEKDLEFLPDSPEFLAYTIDDIGYREKIDNAFQQAITRARSSQP